MKIIYILPYDWGGMPHYTAELVNSTSEYADTIVLGSKDIQSEYFSKNVEVMKIFDTLSFSINNLNTAFSFKNISSFLSFKNINIIDEIKPDIIHLTTPLIPQLSFFIFLYKLDKIYPIVFTKHGIYSNSGLKIKLLEENIINLSERFVKFKKIIVHTKNDKDALIKVKKINDEMVTIIPHGTYTFFKSNSNSNSNRISPQKNCILFFGNIRTYKGLEYLIEAIPFIAEEIPDIKVIIAGEGDLSKYRNLINESNKSRLEVYNEFVPDEQVCELFQRAEIVVLPYSKMSGQSGILNIAYAFDKPVVASDVGGFNELIEDGETGYLVPPKDSNVLAKSIIKILKDETLKKKMEDNVHKKAQEISWANIGKKYIELYMEICRDGN